MGAMSDVSYRLDAMTAEAFGRAAAGNPVILLPLGSHENHGAAAPMGDYRLAEILAERIAEQATAREVSAYVAPTLPFGVGDFFGDAAGGLALSAGSFRAVLGELLEGLLRHGLTRIVILNGHGGNVPVIHEVTLGIKNARGVVVPSFYLWKAARRLMEAVAGPDAGFGHGGEPLLSLNLALRPAETGAGVTARPAGAMLGLPVSGFGTLDFGGIEIDAPVEFGLVGGVAVSGASAARGHEVAAALVAAAVDFVVYFAGEAG
jgi:creatinine amidohydrolase